MTNAIAPRRKPQQDRSRKRVEAILEAAERLLVTSNPDDLSMREIARQADVPIASIYQYFPSKAVILRHLVERNQDRVRRVLVGELERALAEREGPHDIAPVVNRLVAAFFAHYEGHPEAIAVWAGAQADDDLRALDVADNRRLADLLAPYVAQLAGGLDRHTALAVAMLVVEISGHVARLALAQERPLRDDLQRQFAMMVTALVERHAGR